MRVRRVVAALLAMMLGAAMISVLPSSLPASAAAGDPATGDSSVTVSGKGEFANLKVKVSQTKNLINQTVAVSWTGGTATQGFIDFQVNYLQIMQCWGDGPDGPDRTQCQFGALGGQGTAGSWVRSRQLTYGNLVDPMETPPGGATGNVYVPFWAAGRTEPTDPATSNNNEFFDSQVTNEIPLARTHGDGTGQEFFEIETVREAAGLGCGESVLNGATTTSRKCWLVIVPRGATEVNGSIKTGNGTDRLDSSPLSRSNWKNKIVVPLEFQLVGQPCPIGAPERRVVGNELVADAVSSWQPALCAGGGALFGYTQLPDEVARSQVIDGSSPGLALVTNPISPDRALPDRPLVYAPVGLSGLAIAFNVEQQPSPTAAPTDLALAGRRFESMKLTPRLVAKLLTQSYRGSVASVPDELKKNPIGLTVDPEFLELNPEYKGLSFFVQPPDALVQLNGSDLTSLLWGWVKADPEANAFLSGTADPFGMVVNPKNKGLTLPTSTFPRNDESCVVSVQGSDPSHPITLTTCTLDSHPFANDMHDAGHSASRGDSKAVQPVVDNNLVTTAKVDRQAPGQRALLAVVDAVTASRYGLPTAALRNAAGKFVNPTTTSLLAGERAMKPSAVAGVLASDPTATDPAVYPLTALSYAATAPAQLDAAAGKDYAAFLRYASGPGQQPGIAPGQLPLGMVPLPETLKAQTIAAAVTVQAQAGKTTTAPLTSAGTSADGAASGARAAVGAGVAATGSGTTGTRATGGVSGPQGVATQRAGGPAPRVAQQPVARVGRTPSLPAPAVGALILVVLIGGALAATSAPVMHLVSTGLRRPRKEVMPTEQ
jgi:hypothetical protein